MRMFDGMRISGSGMTAERLRLDLIANNLANVNTTRTAAGGPYQRQTAIFSEALDSARSRPGGVNVVGIHKDDSPPQIVHDPMHPDADENGYVAYPNVNIIHEMVDMITASRAYEANVTSVNAFKGMFLKALEIGRG